MVENKIRDIKNMVNNIMDIMGTPTRCWLICTIYVIALMQLISQPSLGSISAMQMVTGYIQDTSKCLHYHWWQPVYYLDRDASYPSQSRGNWAVGAVGWTIMGIYLPIGSLRMIPNNLYLFLISVLPIFAQTNML